MQYFSGFREGNTNRETKTKTSAICNEIDGLEDQINAIRKRHPKMWRYLPGVVTLAKQVEKLTAELSARTALNDDETPVRYFE